MSRGGVSLPNKSVGMCDDRCLYHKQTTLPPAKSGEGRGVGLNPHGEEGAIAFGGQYRRGDHGP